ncbi:MAG: HpcH/HpaI aldolase family protein [Promethearchaeota archaeon]
MSQNTMPKKENNENAESIKPDNALIMFKQKLARHDRVYGVMIRELYNLSVIPLLSEAGLDFCVLDAEHGSISLKEIKEFALSARSTNLIVLVRIAKNHFDDISRIMDMGVDGIMMASVNTFNDAKQVVSNAKYPPIGSRSYGINKFLGKIGLSRVQGVISNKNHGTPKKIGKTTSADYILNSNKSTIVFIQAESPEFNKNFEAIAKLVQKGEIDGVIVGPADYSLSINKIGEYTNPTFEEYIEQILKYSLNADPKIPIGIHFNNLELTKRWAQKGTNIIIFSTLYDLLKEKLKEIIDILKD